MKVIITGATGQAGQQVVQSCLENDRISKVIILTRTALSGDIESHPKVDMLMHQDLTHYSEYILRRLEGAEACIWAIGVRQDQYKDDKAAQRSVGVDLPVAAAKILCEKLARKTPDGTKFRFVYCSRKHTDKSKKTLMFATDTRKLANDLERGVSEIVNVNGSVFEAYTLRPATFLSTNYTQSTSSTSKKLAGLAHSPVTYIQPSRVGKAMVMVACDGWKEKIIENETILKLSN